MKRSKKEEDFLEQIRMIPNISLACEKTDLSRNTIYRWCNEDKDFKKLLDDALKTGTESVSDLSETKLIAHINNGNLRAIKYWLDNHKANYMRPRPKSFWEEMLGGAGPVVTFNMLPPETDPIKAKAEQMAKIQREKQQ